MQETPEKPTNDDEGVADKPQDNHHKIPFDSNLIDVTRPLVTIAHPLLGNVAVLGWVGRGSDNEKIRQPAIWLHQDVGDEDVYNLSYDGIAWHMSYGDEYLRKTDIIHPKDGSLNVMRKNVNHYFNNYNCVTPNYSFTIDKNNVSMIMNNVSIFNEDCSAGCMINLRASFDGLMDDASTFGNVVVLCTIDTLEIPRDAV